VCAIRGCRNPCNLWYSKVIIIIITVRPGRRLSAGEKQFPRDDECDESFSANRTDRIIPYSWDFSHEQSWTATVLRHVLITYTSGDGARKPLHIIYSWALSATLQVKNGTRVTFETKRSKFGDVHTYNTLQMLCIKY